MTKLTWHDLQWCLQRTPKIVLTMLKANPDKLFVAGGFIRSCIANEHINDIDLFVGSKEFGRQVADQMAESFKRKAHETENAYTVTGGRFAIQVIHRWTFDKPEDCVDSFDFTVAQAAFWFRAEQYEGTQDAVAANWKSVCCERFYADLAAKRLVYTSPVREEGAGGSMLRVLKFYQRGYRIPLDSLGAVMARLACAVKQPDALLGKYDHEAWTAKILTGLLREVDPNIDPTHICHLPSEPEDGNVEV